MSEQKAPQGPIDDDAEREARWAAVVAKRPSDLSADDIEFLREFVREGLRQFAAGATKEQRSGE